VLSDTDDTHDVSRYQIFTILVSCMPRYFLVSRYQKYRDIFVDTTHVAKPLIRYFCNFVTLESTFSSILLAAAAVLFFFKILAHYYQALVGLLLAYGRKLIVLSLIFCIYL